MHRQVGSSQKCGELRLGLLLDHGSRRVGIRAAINKATGNQLKIDQLCIFAEDSLGRRGKEVKIWLVGVLLDNREKITDGMGWLEEGLQYESIVWEDHTNDCLIEFLTLQFLSLVAQLASL